MNGRKIIYITRKELETLDKDIPIYILIDPEPTELNEIYEHDIYNISVKDAENNTSTKTQSMIIDADTNIDNSFTDICQSNNNDLMSQHDFLCDDDIFNDDFITSIEITTESVDESDQIRTPEYQGLYTEDLYESIYTSDANSDHKSSDKDCSLRYNSSCSSLTAIVSKTLDSYKQTHSNSYLNLSTDSTTDVIEGGICFDDFDAANTINNLLYGDINDDSYVYKSETVTKERSKMNDDVIYLSGKNVDNLQPVDNASIFQINDDACDVEMQEDKLSHHLNLIQSVDNVIISEVNNLGCLFSAPENVVLSSTNTNVTDIYSFSSPKLYNSTFNSTSFVISDSVSFNSEYTVTPAISNIPVSSIVSSSFPISTNSLDSVHRVSSALTNIDISCESFLPIVSFSNSLYTVVKPEHTLFTFPPPVMSMVSSSAMEPFKIPFSLPTYCPQSYTSQMPQIDLSKPPPNISNQYNMPPSSLEDIIPERKDPEIEKIKIRRNATRTEKRPLIFKQYSSLEMNFNDKYLKKQKHNKNVVVACHKMKSLENRFSELILNRRSMVMINQPAWCAIDRSEFPNRDDVCDDIEPLSTEEKNSGSASDSAGSDMINSDSEDENNDTLSETNLTRLQMNQLAQIEKKVEATRKRLNLNKSKQSKEPNCENEFNYRKRTKSRASFHSNPPKKAKQSAGYLTIQEKNLYNNAPVISGGRTTEQQAEISHKLKHPYKLNADIWYNEPNELNDGPACSCSPKYRIGPLHNEYHGEKPIPICDQNTNNYDNLYHYRLIISPPINFLASSPTIIKHKDKDYAFSGYSIFTHKPVIDLPFCQIVRFNIVYHISLIKEIFPPGFTVKALDLMTDYIFTELLELLDLNWWPNNTDSKSSCRALHLLPRFERSVSHKHVELLSADVILKWMLDNAKQPLFDVMDLPKIHAMTRSDWSELIDPIRGTLATFPGKKPAAIRVDQLDRISLQSKPSDDVLIFPVLVHMSMAPMKLGLTREPAYKRLLRNFLKLQYLILNRPEVTKEDRIEFNDLAKLLENFEMSGIQRREFTVEISSDGFYKTGISTDIVQFALCIPNMMAHIRFHLSLSELEDRIKYTFRDKSLIHQALTHPSFRNTNYGTNPDHYQNTMTSCGLRHIEYGDKISLYRSFRKKGLSKMVHVMSHMPYRHETRSNIYGNERLECHGDAVIELITSVHLFYMFPELSEGHLDAFRQALVQNHYLADLSVKLGFHKFLLYTHNMDFSYDSTITHARSDAFEAVMAAVALDGGLDEADRIFGCALFGDDPRVHKVWCELPMHPLQEQFPQGDRHVIQNSPIFQHLTKLEDRLGIRFKHIRLLAKAMTIRKTGYNVFTLGDNQRLEFLGDSLLKYVTTDYLFKHFPRHHEGHISLLRNTLVNRYTQATVCTELGLDEFIIRKDATKTSNMNKANQKPRADLLEAFLGALFVDKDLTWVERFSQVCFWPRLVDFILNQSWNDPKSRLQQCCLTYRSLNEDPEIAHYKLITTFGSTDHREFKVAVYFRGVRLATGFGKSIQAAQMHAASLALDKYKNDFKQLDYQEKVINDHYDKSTRRRILNQFENWDSELVDKFVESSHGSYKSMGSKFVPDSRTEYSAPKRSTDEDGCEKMRSIALTSSLGELLKSVKKK